MDIAELSREQREDTLKRAVAALKKKNQFNEPSLIKMLTVTATQKGLWDLDEAATTALIRKRFAPKSKKTNRMTQVGVSKETRQKLREIGVKGQTYDEIIQGLIRQNKGTDYIKEL